MQRGMRIFYERVRGRRGPVFCRDCAGKEKANPELELVAVIPYRKRLDSLMEKGREMLEACEEVIVVQEEYHPSMYSRRSRYHCLCLK